MFKEQFLFDTHSLVNFVGAGGKTTLIHRLSQEFASIGPVFCTTTTRIHPPDPVEGLAIVSCDNVALLKQVTFSIVRCGTEHPYKLLVTRLHISPTLLRGVPSDFCKDFDRSCFTILLNEADGAASFSIKMPREGEPVLMEGAEYLVPVIGFDCLNQPADSKTVFRWEKFSEHFPQKRYELISTQLAADMLMHREGVCKGWKPGVKIIPFINKVDDPTQDSIAINLAERLLQNGNFPVERVVYGSLRYSRAAMVQAS